MTAPISTTVDGEIFLFCYCEPFNDPPDILVEEIRSLPTAMNQILYKYYCKAISERHVAMSAFVI